MRRALPLLVAALCARASIAQSETAPPRVQVLDHRALAAAMADFARAHADVASVVAVGTSRAGRSIEALRIGRGPTGPGRPAILVVASLDGPLAWTSGLALDHARALVERAGTDENVRALLDSVTFYLLPRANPDAAEARFATPLAEVEATGPGVDTDRDGRSGEDPPSDVDGDGVIAWMRVPDPLGEWCEDPTEPRALVEADRSKGQRGRWKLVREGRDLDRDEDASEDAPHDAVVNQNFPQGWQEHAPQAGRFATDEPEALALADFLVLHTDVALVVTYGLLDNLGEKPKSKEDGGRRSANPGDGIPAADADLYAEIGRRWKAIGGASGKPGGRESGSFQAWAQAQRGVWTVNLAPWSVPLDEKAPEDTSKEESKAKDDSKAKDEGKPKDAKDEDKSNDDSTDAAKDARPKAGAKPEKKGDDEPKPSDDARRLRWFDAHPDVPGFLPWRAFRHPELGDVEIGGWRPYALVEPPAARRDEIAAHTLDLLVALAGMLPRVRVADVEATALGAGAWRIEAAVVNEGHLPIASALARRAEVLRPVRVALELPAGAKLLGGSRETLVRELAGSGGRREVTWLVRADALDGIAVAVDSDQAGTDRATPEVAR